MEQVRFRVVAEPEKDARLQDWWKAEGGTLPIGDSSQAVIVAERDGQICGVVTLKNTVLMTLAIGKEENAFASVAMFSALRAWADIQGVAGLLVCEQESPCYPYAGKACKEFPANLHFFNIRQEA